MGTGGSSESPGDNELRKEGGRGFTPFTRRAATLLGMATFIAVIALLVWQMITLILVLFLGILLAIFLRGLSVWVAERTKLTDHWALFAITTVLVLLIGVSGWFIAPEVARQANEIGDLIAQATVELQEWISRTALAQQVLVELEDFDLSGFLGGEVLGQVGGAFVGVAGALSHMAFVVVVGVYFAFDPEVYKRGIIRMAPLNYRQRVEEIIAVSTHQLAWWLIGRLLAMLGVAVIITVGLSILGVPLPIFLGVLAGLFSFVPILGPIVSVIPAALLALLVGPYHVIWVMLLFMGAQAVESYLITPVVQYRVVSLPHAMTLIAEIFAGILFGVIGITVATPLAVLLMALINMIYIEDVLGDETHFTELAEKLVGE